MFTLPPSFVVVQAWPACESFDIKLWLCFVKVLLELYRRPGFYLGFFKLLYKTVQPILNPFNLLQCTLIFVPLVFNPAA